MTLEIITSEAGFIALEPVWDKLLNESATHSPFQLWDYVRLWWEAFRAEYQLCIGVVRDKASQVVGIAPLVIGADCGESRQRLRHLGFMNGLGEVQGERMDVLVQSGREAEVTPLLAGVLSKSSASWDVVRLNKVPEESPNHALLLAEMRRCGLAAGVLNQSACRCFDLPESWEVFEKSKSGNFRRNIRRYWGHLLERHQSHVVMDMPSEEAAREFFRLHAMHWPDGVSSFLRPSAMKIHEALLRLWMPKGRVLMPFILVEGRASGSVYAFSHQGEMFICQLGWDKAYASISMGNLAVRACVQEAIQRGLKMADFLPGEYRYKREWSSRVREVSDLECFHRLHPRSLLFLALRALKRRFARAEPEPAAAAATKPEENEE